MSGSDKVYTRPAPSIIDCTLREGMQAPGVQFTADQSLEIAQLLCELGVDMIECGYPFMSSQEHARVRRITELGLSTPILSHARANEYDILAVAQTGAQWVGIFLGVNGISRDARIPNRSLDDLFRMIDKSVRYAISLGLSVRYTVEDASKTDQKDLCKAFKIAIDAGASRIGYADTVGILEPLEVTQRVSELRKVIPSIPVEVHFHDDRGLSMANALAAIDSGVDWVSTAVNGIGERCGITDLCGLLANLLYRGDRPLPNPHQMIDLSRRVSTYARSYPDHQRPVVGRNAFSHTAKLHVEAARRRSVAYEWLSPDLVGREREDNLRTLPSSKDWVVSAKKIPSTELRHHRRGPGERYVLIDERFVSDSRQYCIARKIPLLEDYGEGHVDSHIHHCDSLFIFLGDSDNYEGLMAEVELENDKFVVSSPASVFIPAGVRHSYRVLSGSGTYINHVLSGSYNESLLEPVLKKHENSTKP
jgi:2-isopropylmalate synthase